MLRQSAPKILILENQLIIAADISLQLCQLGYDVLGITINSKDLIKNIKSKRPDIVLMNLKAKNTEERLRTARIVLKTFQTAVILLSAHIDREVFKQIILIQPYAFISKPFDVNDLQRGMKTALDRMQAEGYWNDNIRYVSTNR